MKGRLIVFEGIDHTGKTTQIDLAVQWLQRLETQVERYREPGGTSTGERIRSVLLEKDGGEMLPETEMLLFFASRVQLAVEKVVPALAGGRAVVLDRYWFATAAYQGPFLQGGVDRVIAFAEQSGLPRANLVVCLDGEPETLARRKTDGHDRIESKGIEYQRTVRRAYQQMAASWPSWFKMVDATRPIEEVHRDVVQILTDGLKV